VNGVVPQTVLIVPGLRRTTLEHRQTILERSCPTQGPYRMDRASEGAALLRRVGRQAPEDCLAQIDGPVILAAHSAGCMIVVHRAQRHRRPDQAERVSPLRRTSSRRCPKAIPRRKSCSRTAGCRPARARPSSFCIVAASGNDPLGRLGAAWKPWRRCGAAASSTWKRATSQSSAAAMGRPQAEQFIRELME
jgi:predicted alpha/beta hydrolase family esterase